MQDDLSHDHFAPLVGDTFVLRAADGQIDAELIEASADGDSPAPGLRAPFSLTWQGPPAPALQQGIHEIQHPVLGEHVIFLVPIARTDAGMQYQAVFA